MTKAWVWGTHGIEFFEKGHGIFKVAFAVADQHKTKMAWYMWRQGIEGKSPYKDKISKDFIEVELRGGIPERRIRFGGLSPTAAQIEIPVPFNALARSDGAGNSVNSTLYVHDEHTGNYGCIISIFTLKAPMSQFLFFLSKEAERHLIETSAPGFHGSLRPLETSPFSQNALSIGPADRIVRSLITTVS